MRIDGATGQSASPEGWRRKHSGPSFITSVARRFQPKAIGSISSQIVGGPFGAAILSCTGRYAGKWARANRTRSKRPRLNIGEVQGSGRNVLKLLGWTSRSLSMNCRLRLLGHGLGPPVAIRSHPPCKNRRP